MLLRSESAFGHNTLAYVGELVGQLVQKKSAKVHLVNDGLVDDVMESR
jgi:hypothetical protein